MSNKERKIRRKERFLLSSLLALTSATAFAQTDTPPIDSSDGSSPWKQLRLGAFDFQPRATAGAIYDDNILISTRDQQKADTIWSLQPGLQISAGDALSMTEYRLDYGNPMNLGPHTYITSSPEYWPGKMLLLDYAPKYNAFTRYDENNSFDQILGFNAVWPLTKMILGANLGYRNERTTVIEAGRRSDQEIISAAITSGYQFNEKSSIELNFRRNSRAYAQRQGLNDSTDWINDDWYNLQITPLLNVGAGLTLGYTEVPNNLSQTYEQLLARARYQLTERISAGLAAGGELRQFESGQDDTLLPVLSADAAFRPLVRTFLSLNGYRRNAASVYDGLNYTITGVGIGISQQLADRYFLNLRISYDNYVYSASAQNLSIDRNDNYLTISPGFQVRFSRHLIGNLSYLYRTLESSAYDGFSNNQVNLQVTWKY